MSSFSFSEQDQIFGDNWEEVIHEKGSSHRGGRRWHGIETTKQQWQRR
jgi:hypothetical protein